MAKVYPEITQDLAAWIREQPMFFVGSAPLSPQGHVNISPRGLDTLRILDPNQVAFLDLTGSGNESAAHVAENHRITLLFCAFSGEPRILRLYGEGEVILPGSAEWAELRPEFPSAMPGERQIFRILVTRVQTSCGYGVPLMDYRGQRQRLIEWAEEKGERLSDYWTEKNAVSIDGLPAPGRGRD